ncbi:MAG: hypothetical protein WCQ47_05500 [bacterium]
MKKSIFVLLSIIFMSSGVFAQDAVNTGYPDVDKLIQAIPDDINKWDGETCLFNDSDKQIKKEEYDLFTSFHSGYLNYGDTFNTRTSYKNVVDDVKKSVSVISKGLTTKSNPVISYLTLGAIYLYSFEMVQAAELAKGNSDAEYKEAGTSSSEKRAANIALNRLREMYNYALNAFNDSGAGFQLHVMQYLDGTPSDPSDPVFKDLKSQDDAVKMLATFSQYKQMIDTKINAMKAEYLKAITAKSIEKKKATLAITSAKIAQDQVKPAYDKAVANRDNAQKAYDNALKANTEALTAKASADLAVTSATSALEEIKKDPSTVAVTTAQIKYNVAVIDQKTTTNNAEKALAAKNKLKPDYDAADQANKDAIAAKTLADKAEEDAQKELDDANALTPPNPILVATAKSKHDITLTAKNTASANADKALTAKNTLKLDYDKVDKASKDAIAAQEIANNTVDAASIELQRAKAQLTPDLLAKVQKAQTAYDLAVAEQTKANTKVKQTDTDMKKAKTALEKATEDLKEPEKIYNEKKNAVNALTTQKN